MWDKPATENSLKRPILQQLDKMGLTYQEIVYGQYSEEEYLKSLQLCRAMIFLCEHESQGFALCEALSMDVPVFAWDQGFWLDPNRFKWNDPEVFATSVPYFDNHCGLSFKNLEEFENSINIFWQNAINKSYKPREYVMENLTLKKSAERMIEIINSVYK